ncbi:hypothetical protein Ddye_005438 [Dipteronia dyeriana]|uniref:Uncharacterized protein n=1 Tax=Dipteronia dyeriana TaxID=168575 RepID=A0AAD9XG71_9ROSI|nr:hypothetical protein Ddye_005438 [Dipteronia dyeriana]
MLKEVDQLLFPKDKACFSQIRISRVVDWELTGAFQDIKIWEQWKELKALEADDEDDDNEDGAIAHSEKKAFGSSIGGDGMKSARQVRDQDI